jgi:hypothetical protein
MPNAIWRALAALLAVLAVSACSGQPVHGPVTLEQSTTTWETYAYELTRFNTIRAGSFDGETRVTHTFDTWILENDYLEVTLLPEFGGRILSIVSKSTGHEHLYRNLLGVPYQIDTNVFFFNWLMVYGGIFPTFPEPEHGKTWFLPWSFEVLEESDERVTVAMSFADTTDWPLVPRQYRGEATGLEVTFVVTLEADRAAVDTTVAILNPGEQSVEYEYWTSAAFAPGSAIDDPRATERAEIIAPTDLIAIPGYWRAISAVEIPTGLADVYEFDRLRRFENWPDMGIAYAHPDMSGGGFWGVIDHITREGIFRMADNSITPGLKLWTWGYPQTAGPGPAAPEEAGPYIEMWAGVTRQFFEKEEIGAGERVLIDETYAPTAGLSGVTHANRNFLVNLTDPVIEVFGVRPGQTVRATVLVGGSVIHQSRLVLDPTGAAQIPIESPEAGTSIVLMLTDESGTVLFEAGGDS